MLFRSAPTDAGTQSAQCIQRAFRHWKALRGIRAAAALRREHFMNESALLYAATTLQSAWRGHCVRRRPAPVTDIPELNVARAHVTVVPTCLSGPLGRNDTSTPHRYQAPLDPFRGLAHVCSYMPQLPSDHIDVKRSLGSFERRNTNTDEWQQVAIRQKMLADIRIQEAKYQKMLVAATMIEEKRALQNAVGAYQLSRRKTWQ